MYLRPWEPPSNRYRPVMGVGSCRCASWEEDEVYHFPTAILLAPASLNNMDNLVLFDLIFCRKLALASLSPAWLPDAFVDPYLLFFLLWMLVFILDSSSDTTETTVERSVSNSSPVSLSRPCLASR